MVPTGRDLARRRPAESAAGADDGRQLRPGDGCGAGIQALEGDGEVGGLSLDQNVEPGGPLVLLYCDDLDATVAVVEDAGGTIAEQPYAFPGGRRFTFFDPSGNRLGVCSTTQATCRSGAA
jgi:predicted enzyme related to lactoylglutathione lyase